MESVVTADPDADEVHDVCRRVRVPASVGFAVVNTDVWLVCVCVCVCVCETLVRRADLCPFLVDQIHRPLLYPGKN